MVEVGPRDGLQNEKVCSQSHAHFWVDVYVSCVHTEGLSDISYARCYSGFITLLNQKC